MYTQQLAYWATYRPRGLTWTRCIRGICIPTHYLHMHRDIANYLAAYHGTRKRGIESGMVYKDEVDSVYVCSLGVCVCVYAAENSLASTHYLCARDASFCGTVPHAVVHTYIHTYMMQPTRPPGSFQRPVACRVSQTIRGKDYQAAAISAPRSFFLLSSFLLPVVQHRYTTHRCVCACMQSSPESKSYTS